MKKRTFFFDQIIPGNFYPCPNPKSDKHNFFFLSIVFILERSRQDYSEGTHFMNDAALVSRSTSGDTGAFNLLIARWQRPIFNFIYRTVGNEESAKDICQTTFIRVFKEIKKLRDPEKFSPWLFQIAVNLCRDEIRRKPNQRRFISIDDLIHQEDSSPMKRQFSDDDSRSPEDEVNHRQISDILKEAMMRLPEEQRVVIVMKQYQGLKFTEISSILKQSENTIKSRLYYGLRALRKYLEESELDQEVMLHEM